MAAILRRFKALSSGTDDQTDKAQKENGSQGQQAQHGCSDHRGITLYGQKAGQARSTKAAGGKVGKGHA